MIRSNSSSLNSTPNLKNVNRKNRMGETFLHRSTIKGDLEKVQELLELGADPNVKDNAGWTPLHEACNYGHYGIASLLLEFGADINAKGLDSQTPLHDSIMNNHYQISELLLMNHADLYAKDDNGKTAMDMAQDTRISSLLETYLSDNGVYKTTDNALNHSYSSPTKSNRSFTTIDEQQNYNPDLLMTPIKQSMINDNLDPDTLPERATISSDSDVNLEIDPAQARAIALYLATDPYLDQNGTSNPVYNHAIIDQINQQSYEPGSNTDNSDEDTKDLNNNKYNTKSKIISSPIRDSHDKPKRIKLKRLDTNTKTQRLHFSNRQELSLSDEETIVNIEDVADDIKNVSDPMQTSATAFTSVDAIEPILAPSITFLETHKLILEKYKSDPNYSLIEQIINPDTFHNKHNLLSAHKEEAALFLDQIKGCSQYWITARIKRLKNINLRLPKLVPNYNDLPEQTQYLLQDVFHSILHERSLFYDQYLIEAQRLDLYLKESMDSLLIKNYSNNKDKLSLNGVLLNIYAEYINSSSYEGTNPHGYYNYYDTDTTSKEYTSNLTSCTSKIKQEICRLIAECESFNQRKKIEHESIKAIMKDKWDEILIETNLNLFFPLSSDFLPPLRVSDNLQHRLLSTILSPLQ